MELSRRFKDRQNTPKEEVIYWTDYVIKHKGAQHLKTAALKLSWYQYLLIDIIITVVLIALVGLSVMVFLLKTIKNCVCNLRKSKKEWVWINWFDFNYINILIDWFFKVEW